MLPSQGTSSHMRPFWQFPDSILSHCALRWPGGELSYAELDTLIGRWGERLRREAGVERPLIALEFTPEPDVIAAYLAALRAGFPIVVGEAGTLGPGKRIHDKWKPNLVLSRGETGDLAIRSMPDAPDDTILHPELRLLLSTSGSTGDPKLVRLSQTNIASNAAAIVEYLGLTASDIAMLTLPLFYSYGLSVLHSYLHAGASLFLTEQSVVEPQFWSEFRACRATSLALVPHQIDLLRRTGFAEMELPSLRYVTQAGGKLAPDAVLQFASIARKAGWDFYVMYGQTEASPRISYVPPEQIEAAYDTIGKPIPGGRMWLRGPDGERIDMPGIAGELVYAGPNVMMGYGSERADLALGPENSELATGDIAELTKAGFFRVVGRKRRFVKLYGKRFNLDEIEHALHDSGIEGYACSVDDRLVVLHIGSDDEKVRRTIADLYELPPTSVQALAIEAVPLLPSGKTDRKALQAQAETVTAEGTSGISIRDVIARQTRSESVAPDQSFSMLGGDSLSYLHVQMALEERLGYVPDRWEDMPLSQLEQLVPIAREGSSRQVGIDVLLRVLALSTVVAVHSGLSALYGGPWALIALMGYVMAKFQGNMLASGKILPFLAKTLYPIIPLYFGLLVLINAAYARVPSAFFLLYSNYFVGDRSPILAYWFVSFYVQTVLLMALLFAWPPVRRAYAKSAWAFGGSMLALWIVVEAAALFSPLHEYGLLLWPVEHPDSHGLEACLPVFFMGWMIQTSSRPLHKLFNILAAAAVVLLFAQLKMPVYASVYLAATLALLIVNPRISLPGWVATLMQRAATVTLFVYLLHLIVISALSKLHDEPAILAPIAIPASYLIAYLVKQMFDRADAFAFDSLFRLTEKVRRRWHRDVRFGAGSTNLG